MTVCPEISNRWRGRMPCRLPQVSGARVGIQSLPRRVRCAPWLFGGMGRPKFLSTAKFLIRNSLRAKCWSACGPSASTSRICSSTQPPAPDLAPGARVVALAMFSAYAERVAVPAHLVFCLPDDVPFAEAAAIPVNYLTAYHSMFQMGNLQPGDRILIHGAAGGVGIAVVQLARAQQLEIFGTAGPSKQDFLRQIGVDHPIDYTREDFQQAVRRIAPDGIEMVMDPIGGKSFD